MSIDNLGAKTRKGLAWDLAGSMARQIAAFAISILLARLLSPTEFGVIGIAMVFISLTDVFIDVGFTDGVVQRKEVTETMLTSVFYINFSISIVLALIIIATAPAIGAFYQNPQVTQVLYYLGIIPPIAALGKVHSAILVRNMNFKALALRTLVATIVGGLVGLWAAVSGKGVFSLVWQQVTFALVATCSLWYGSKWRPKWLFSFTEVKPLLNFSQYVFFDQLLRQFFNRINTLFVGKIFSPAILGYYSRAESLNTLVGDYTANSLRKVIFPVLSSVQQDEDRFSRIYFKSIGLAAAVAATLAGCLYFLGEGIIIGLLGEKWRGCVGIFKIIIFVTLISPHFALITKAILSKGLAKLMFKMGLIQRLLLLLPLPIGFWYDIETFTLAVVLIKFLILFVLVFYAKQSLGFSMSRQLKGMILPALPLFILSGLFTWFLPNISDFISVLIFLFVQIFFLIYLRHDIIDLVKDVVIRGKLTLAKKFNN